jgi:hypothetical protein
MNAVNLVFLAHRSRMRQFLAAPFHEEVVERYLPQPRYGDPMLCFGKNSGCCDLVHVQGATPRIRWDILSLECVWCDSGTGIGAHQPLNTGDEMLFATNDLVLQAIRIRVPEVNSKAFPNAWDAAKREFGIPRLCSTSSFEPRLMQLRYYDWKDDSLSVFAMPTSAGEPRRIAVHPSLSILAQGIEATGWRLDRASTYITSPLDDTVPRRPGTGSDHQRKLLGNFLTTVDDVFVQRMEEQDPKARTTLEALLRETRTTADDAVSEVLSGWILDILDRFY